MNKHLKMICDDLWGRTIACVEANCELIEGLSARLASEVHAVNVETRLTAEDIDATRYVKKRFGL